jgi:hypothetical protein
VTRMGAWLIVSSVVLLAGCGSAHSAVAPSTSLAGDDVPALASSAVAATASARHGAGGPIVVDRGSLEYSGQRGVASMAGTRGFSLKATLAGAAGVVEAMDACADGCAPSAAIPLRAFWSGSDLDAVITLDGTSYEHVGSLATDTSASIEFVATAVAPPANRRGRAGVTVPFSFYGQFIHIDAAGAAVQDAIQGAGTVRVSLAWSGTGWSVESLAYRFKH